MCQEPGSRRLSLDTQSQPAPLKEINTSINIREGKALETNPSRSPVVLQGASQHEERQPDGSAEGQRHESCNGTRQAVRRELPHRLPVTPSLQPPLLPSPLRRCPGNGSSDAAAPLPQRSPDPRDGGARYL